MGALCLGTLSQISTHVERRHNETRDSIHLHFPNTNPENRNRRGLAPPLRCRKHCLLPIVCCLLSLVGFPPLLSRSLHLPVEVTTRCISAPALPTASLHTAGHTNDIGGIGCTCGGDIGTRDGSRDGSLAPFSIQSAIAGTRVLCPACGDGIIVIAFGVNDSCRVSGDAGREVDRVRVSTVTLCV